VHDVTFQEDENVTQETKQKLILKYLYCDMYILMYYFFNPYILVQRCDVMFTVTSSMNAVLHDAYI
jgi:hypothetical protein